METGTVKQSNHGPNLRRWREWRGIKQDVLAEMMGITQSTLSQYEKKDKLEWGVLEKAAKALNIPVEAITELEQGTAINIVANTFSDNAIANQNHPTFNPIDKIIELFGEKEALYERMLKEKDGTILLLQEVLKGK